jgi:hypothetical protein
MKRVFLISLMILFIANNVAAMETQSIELVYLAEAMHDNELEIDEWEVTFKEHKDLQELRKLIKELSNGHSVIKKENENSIIYSVTDTHKMGNIIVSYNAIIPTDKQYRPELVVTLKGNGWSKEIKASFLQLFQNMTNAYFTKEVKIFSCMSTRPNAIIENEIIVENITEKLKISYLTTKKDNLKTTKKTDITYGYTVLWGRNITIQDKPVNVQIVTKILGNGDVQYLIGTPILINEY